MGYHGSTSQFAYIADVTRGMEYEFMHLRELLPPDHIDEKTQTFFDFMDDRKRNLVSSCNDGQLVYNVSISDKSVLLNNRLRAYEGSMRTLEPKPRTAVLNIPDRGNLNGRPFDGSTAQFVTLQLKWLSELKRVIWCLDDKALVAPFDVDTTTAKNAIEQEMAVKIVGLKTAEPHVVFENGLTRDW